MEVAEKASLASKRVANIIDAMTGIVLLPSDGVGATADDPSTAAAPPWCRDTRRTATAATTTAVASAAVSVARTGLDGLGSVDHLSGGDDGGHAARQQQAGSDECEATVRPHGCAPFSRPKRPLSLIDGSGVFQRFILTWRGPRRDFPRPCR